MTKLNADMPVFKDHIVSQTGGTANYTISQILPVSYGRVIVVRLTIHCVAPSGQMVEVCNNLPYTSRGVSALLVDGSYQTLPIRAEYYAQGNLHIQGGMAGKNYVGEIVAISSFDI